ncbi:hypothetical protein BACOV975_04665 [Bacteroides ovatus V975]|nr:hypothetical protein BACOV975_04665 [Bacteroides ovatus V975]
MTSTITGIFFAIFAISSDENSIRFEITSSADEEE